MLKPKASCLSEIQRLQSQRDERRKNTEQAKVERAAEEQRNKDDGTPGDIDFQRMIVAYRNDNMHLANKQHLVTTTDSKICIVIRKRPISSKEVKKFDYDAVTCLHPLVVVHATKLKVDGISKYLDNTPFQFDHTFHEDETTDELYRSTVLPLVNFVLGGGRGTVFAYGQTGSGKTYTMQGIQQFVVSDLYAALEEASEEIQVFVSYFEIYGGRCQDLLNGRQRLNVREDGGGEVVVSDLVELDADTEQNLHNIIETGNRNRTTHATESNDESSRSHAICQIALRNASSGALVGRLSLIDLAGSERGADTKSHNRQRRMEGAEINKSLLALKECIRALDSGSSHVPYRASKLTLVLKDSFTNKKSKTVMIANVSPAASNADHTINTLRYADRIKGNKVTALKSAPAVGGAGAGAGGGGGGGGGGNRRSVSPVPLAEKKDRKETPASSALAQLRAPSYPKDGPGIAAAKDAVRDRRDSRDSHGREVRDNGSKAAYSPPSADYNSDCEDDAEERDRFNQTVQDLFEEEEDLLNLHMSVIQENAELLTEEGKLLQQIQSENNDIDSYASRLNQILQRKQDLIAILREKLDHFRSSLNNEEKQSSRLNS